MSKVVTYFRYFMSYLRHGDVGSIVSSLNFLLKRPTHSNDRIIKSSIGTFYCRKFTNDFQFANYYYEWTVKKRILDLCQKENVFIDGGACIGDYCVLLAKKGVRCFAFEPVSSTFQTLKKNIELNNLQDTIKAYPTGLGKAAEEVRFEINPVNTGASHKTVKPAAKTELVSIKTLDSYLPEMAIEINRPILFKLDVEGMEIEAIEGAANFIKSYPHLTLIVETKHAGPRLIEETLNAIAPFRCEKLDSFNLIATRL